MIDLPEIVQDAKLTPPAVCSLIIAVGLKGLPYGGTLMQIEKDDEHGSIANEFDMCGNLEEALDLDTSELAPGVYRVGFELIWRNEGVPGYPEYVPAASKAEFTPVSWPL